jgi:hypothetical protein
MMKKRRRFKQTTTLAQRLTAQAGSLRSQAKNLPPGMEQTELWRKVRQAETALRIDRWLAPTDVSRSNNMLSLMDNGPRKRLSSKTEST